jgi:uncharacterized phage protein (TIGR02218 family)
MKILDAGLQVHLDSGVTTLCWCWRLVRRDGTVQGFTDHDRDVTFAGVTYEAASGFTSSDIRDAVGLSVDNLDVSGALSSEALSEADLTAGHYDDARVEIYRVNWQEPEQRVLMRAGSLGEVRRSGTAFTAEVRGLAHYLQQPSGRLFQMTCDADLGDRRCGVNLDDPAYRASGTVLAAATDRRLTATGLATFSHDFFTRGLLTITSGDQTGARREVKTHTNRNGVAGLELWTALPAPLPPGVTFEITAGCDKRLATCRNRFANTVNFRGFPTMPGNGLLARVGRRG